MLMLQRINEKFPDNLLIQLLSMLIKILANDVFLDWRFVLSTLKTFKYRDFELQVMKSKTKLFLIILGRLNSGILMVQTVDL